MAYTVTAPLVVVQDEQGSYHHVYQGAPVPKFVTGADLKRLANEGLIGQADDAATEPLTVPAKSADKATWVAFAVSQGMAEDEAKATKKDDLAARYLEAAKEPAGAPAGGDASSTDGSDGSDGSGEPDPDRLTS